MISFSVVFIGFLIAHECDHSSGSLLPSEIQSQAFVFSPSGGGCRLKRTTGGRPEREFRCWCRSLLLSNFRMRLHHRWGGGTPVGEPAHGHYRSSGGDNHRCCLHKWTKGKIRSWHGRGVLIILLIHLVSGYGVSDTVDSGGGGRVKGKSADTLQLWRCQQRGNKG